MFPKALPLVSLYAGMAVAVVAVYRHLLGSKASKSSGDGYHPGADGRSSSDGGDFGHHVGHDGDDGGGGDGSSGGDGGGGGDGGRD